MMLKQSKRVRKYSKYCVHCNHKWKSYKKDVKLCPNCGRYLNKKYLKRYFCTICKHMHRDGSKLYVSHYYWRKKNKNGRT